MKKRTLASAVAVTALALSPSLATAQTGTSEQSAASAGGSADLERLMGLRSGELKREITSRYDEALAKTRNAAVIGADTEAFMWASQAKVQCGIARGYLKSGTKDRVSIGKCADAYARMQGPATPAPAPAVPEYVPPQEPTLPVLCNKGPFIVFFDWNSADITPEATTTLDSMLTSYAGCGGAAVTISGYADRSGSDRYNLGLSDRRAQGVSQYLTGKGLSGGAVTAKGYGETNPRVPTEDGVRELQNRRVEIVIP